MESFHVEVIGSFRHVNLITSFTTVTNTRVLIRLVISTGNTPFKSLVAGITGQVNVFIKLHIFPSYCALTGGDGGEKKKKRKKGD